MHHGRFSQSHWFAEKNFGRNSNRKAISLLHWKKFACLSTLKVWEFARFQWLCNDSFNTCQLTSGSQHEPLDHFDACQIWASTASSPIKAFLMAFKTTSKGQLGDKHMLHFTPGLDSSISLWYYPWLLSQQLIDCPCTFHYALPSHRSIYWLLLASGVHTGLPCASSPLGRFSA